MSTGHTVMASVVAVLMLSVSACSSSMGTDAGATDARSGYDTTRDGLARVRDGVRTYEGGDHSSGLMRMHEGLGMMARGTNEMHTGVGMMSGDMMHACNGSKSTLDAIDGAMSSMGDGLKMMEDGDATNDGAGMDAMKHGLSSAENGMDMMGTSMTCMGHGDMM